MAPVPTLSEFASGLNLCQNALGEKLMTHEFKIDNRSIVLVDSIDQIQRLLIAIESEEEIGVDLEADSLHHYRDRVCLVQISTSNTDWVVDPGLGKNLDPLWAFFEKPDRLKIFHDADFDLRSLNRDYNLEVKNIFDTKISLELLGSATLNLAAVLQKHFNVTMSKKYQKYNWSRRPLKKEALIYAAMDTRYLIDLKKLIQKDLVKMNRLGWAMEEFEHLEKLRWQPSKRDILTFWRLAGRKMHKPQYLEALRLLWDLRENEAERTDTPVYRIFPDSVLVEIAGLVYDLPDQKAADLLKEVIPEIRDRILPLLHHAIKTPNALCPVYPAQLSAADPSYNINIYDRLRQFRDSAADRERIDPAVVSGNKVLKKLAELPVETLRDHTKVIQICDIRHWQWKILTDNRLLSEI